MGIGGGGLLAGVAVAVKELARRQGRHINIIGVQAEHAAAYPPSLAADAVVPLTHVSTIADGIAVGKPGQIPFQIIKELVDGVVTVSEDAIANALVFLLERSKMVVEPAGVVGVAALLEEGELAELGIESSTPWRWCSPAAMLKPLLDAQGSSSSAWPAVWALPDREDVPAGPTGEVCDISRIVRRRTPTGHARVGQQPDGQYTEHGGHLHHDRRRGNPRVPSIPTGCPGGCVPPGTSRWMQH